MALRDPGTTIPSLGYHTRGMYVSLFGRLVSQGASGALTVQSDGEFRRLHFVAGSPVWFESTEPGAVLSDEDIEDPDKRTEFVKIGIVAPLRWEKGGWTFEESEGLPAEMLLKAVFLDCSPLEPLWAGIQESLRQDEVLGPITDRTAGPVVPRDGLAENFKDLGIEGALSELPDNLARPASVPELLRRFAHEHQAFFKVLWMMEVLGWIERDGNRDRALGMVPPLDDPFAGQPMAPFDAPPTPVDPVPVSDDFVEPDTREVDIAEFASAALPSNQVVDAIRQGAVPQSPSELLAPSGEFETVADPAGSSSVEMSFDDLAPLLGEWQPGTKIPGTKIPPLTRTVPSAEPENVLPDLPSYRPSTRPPEEDHAPDRRSAKQPTPRRRPQTLPGLRPPTSPPRAATVREDEPTLTEPVPVVEEAPEPATRQDPRRTTGTNPTARRIPSLKGSRLSTTGSVPAALSPAAVRRDYRQRMGTDYYTFLGVPAKANQSVIDRAWTRLLKRWTAASKNKRLPKDVRQMARELAQVTHLAGRTFSVPARRQEYDRRMDRGQAPLAGGIRAARARDLPKTNPAASLPTAPTADGLADARAYLDARDYARATSLLKSLRVQRPSDPDVLSTLGWAVWKASAETERDQAEEYLQLATTFDPRHVASREWLARIALDAGDHHAARTRLERFLKVQPHTDWAHAALERLPVADDGKGGGRRLAFWKK